MSELENKLNHYRTIQKEIGKVQSSISSAGTQILENEMVLKVRTLLVCLCRACKAVAAPRPLAVKRSCAAPPRPCQELDILEEDAQVFKLIGPVLVKQVNDVPRVPWLGPPPIALSVGSRSRLVCLWHNAPPCRGKTSESTGPRRVLLASATPLGRRSWWRSRPTSASASNTSRMTCARTRTALSPLTFSSCQIGARVIRSRFAQELGAGSIFETPCLCIAARGSRATSRSLRSSRRM